MTPRQPLLQVKDLVVQFETEMEKTTAVGGISFDLDRGETLAIVGESGSGKSVTSLSILRLLPRQTVRYPKGEILFSPDGGGPIDLLHQQEQDLRRIRGNRIAMIFQEPMTSLNPVFTCGFQVTEAIRLHQPCSYEAARQKALELFSKVQLPMPESLFHRYPHQLSGGQKQRVMIAMAMSCQPDLLICDEPTTALDVTVQKSILQLIRDLQQEENMAVIFITHDLGVVAEVADRVLVMHRGEIMEQGQAAAIFSNPEHPYTQGLLACRPALHAKGDRLPVVSDFWPDTGSRKRAVAPAAKAVPDAGPKKAVMEIRDLCVWYPARKNILGRPLSYVKAVDGISFDIYEGETLGLVGESGCGKTTLGRAMLGLVNPHSGSIRYQQQDITGRSRKAMTDLRKNIQIVFQDPYSSLNPRIQIGEAIAEPIRVHGLAGSEKTGDRVVQLLEKVGLQADHRHRYPHEFSGGQRQRIVIARALALNPEFLVCDESVSALDVSVQAQVLNLLNDLKAEFGFTIVFISHDLSVVHYLSDRILVMQKGRMVELGDAGQVYQRPQTEYARSLVASIPSLGRTGMRDRPEK